MDNFKKDYNAKLDLVNKLIVTIYKENQRSSFKTAL